MKPSGTTIAREPKTSYGTTLASFGHLKLILSVSSSVPFRPETSPAMTASLIPGITETLPAAHGAPENAVTSKKSSLSSNLVV